MRNRDDKTHRNRRSEALTLLAACFAAVGIGEYIHSVSLKRNLKSAISGYEESRRRMDETAVFRHDCFKHMDAVQVMLAEGQTERALAYLRELSGRAEQTSGAVFTGNYLIDLALNSRLAPAREAGVRVCVTAAQVPEKLRISDDALFALLSNALDNAVAAAKAAGEGNRRIDIELHGKGQMLFIGISNSCAKADGARPGTPRRKGYGQRIMQRIVNRYDGVMQAESSGGCYRLSLLLPVIP